MARQHQHVEAKQPFTIRTRDICGLMAVLLVGAALVYTAFMRGAHPSGNLSVAAFVIGAILVTVGYGTGSVIDRIGRRHPFLTKKRNHPLAFVVLVPVMVMGILLLWWERDKVVEDVTDGTKTILVEVNERVDMLGMP
jgi:MFS family permease